MAQKKISELQLITAIADSQDFAVDNGTQTYRCTALQLKNFILASENVVLSMLKTDIFTGLTGTSVADDDYLLFVDTSDLNLTKKVLVSSFVRNQFRAASTFPVTVSESSDGVISLSGATGAVNLPTAVGLKGRKLTFIHAGTSFLQTYTIDGAGSETIGDAATFAMHVKGELVELTSNDVNWEISGRFIPSKWEAYTPASTQGMGTVGTVEMKRRRVGDSLQVRGRLTVGTNTTSEARLSFNAAGEALAAAANISTTEVSGVYSRSDTVDTPKYTLQEPGTGYICFANGTNPGLTKATGIQAFNNGVTISVKAEIPIAGWNG